MSEESAMITIRLEKNLKTAFEKVAKELDLTSSQMLRQHIRRIVQQYHAANAQGTLELESMPTHQPTTKKPAKGQKMASVKPANWIKP